MTRRHLAELLTLAALWGASFLFLRLGAGEFGAVALAGLRVAGAGLALLPLLLWRREGPALRSHWRPLAVLGLSNSALPFLCFGYAVLTIDAGLSSIFNAASPLFGALIGWWWLHDRLSGWRVLGLLIGFTGVLGLAASQSGLRLDAQAMAIGACIVGTLAYGFSANFAKRHLAGVPPLAVATGSQLAAALVLALPAWWWWPATTPGPRAWAGLAMLAVVCTGFAYILYFRLITQVGPAKAITVTFLIPAFAVAWGALFLGEAVTLPMLAGCAVILLGTTLATGLWTPRRRGF